MKYLTALVMSLVLLCSCNNNDVPPTETILNVAEHYQPCTVVFSSDDTEWLDRIKGWSDKKFVVNDVSELPDDPMGFSDAYTGVDFSEYTMLITYNLHNWNIDTYHNRYYYDNVEGIYEWAICIGTSTVPDDKAEPWYFTRYAILVSKLPRDAKVQMWFSLGVLNWNWK